MSAVEARSPGHRHPTQVAAWRAHLPEYASEALGLGLFMISACCFALLLEHPESPVRQALPSAFGRRALMGLAMGATLVANVHAPWGRRSGAHLNPAATLAFWRLGRVPLTDVAGYVSAQFAGATAGVAVVEWFARRALADPHVHHVVTTPGPRGAGLAFVAEFLMAFVLLSIVLRVMASERHAQRTPWVAGALVATYIAVEAPLSGMSLNPARTFGSALAARDWQAYPVYVLAPVLAMLAAAELWRWECAAFRRSDTGCAKLLHRPDDDCVFCGQRATRAKPAANTAGTSAAEPAFTSGRGSTGPTRRSTSHTTRFP